MVSKHKIRIIFFYHDNHFFVLLFLVFLAILTFCGCQSSETVPMKLEKIIFNSNNQINNESPVPINVVLCYDSDLFKKIAQMDANTYYKEKPQLLKDYKEKIEVIAIDALPGFTQEVAIQPAQPVGAGGFIFARYDQSNAANRMSIGTDSILNIDLGSKEFMMQQKP